MAATLRTFVLRLHWALGLGAGLALVLTGVTGAIARYEAALQEWIDTASRW
ncbi:MULTISPECIES: hypothetical protein [Methylorubrum]|uniref:PepSY domain-containing protein n=1 Tax=Methylorubrum suomiense TaxID=144191 RepID=A0ABQ4UTM7_9HYPH|nr:MULTISPECIES: hypothetical protein [Methylobacteriaceae]GJE75350.1 hypothetical protein BGCPKDLD_1934 [Methylorubrum suomiense]